MAKNNFCESCKKYCLVNGVDIQFYKPVYKHKQSHLWYGGEVATVLADNYYLTLAAKGNIRIDLFGKENELVLIVEDSTDSGIFQLVAEPYIKSDKQLEVKKHFGQMKCHKENSWVLIVEKIPEVACDDEILDFCLELPLTSKKFSRALKETISLLQQGDILNDP